VKGETVVDE